MFCHSKVDLPSSCDKGPFKVYKVAPSSSVCDVIHLICKKLSIDMTDKRIHLHSLAGHIFEERDSLSLYGFGSILSSWEVCLSFSPLLPPLFGSPLSLSLAQRNSLPSHTERRGGEGEGEKEKEKEKKEREREGEGDGSPLHVFILCVESLRERGLRMPHLFSSPFSLERVRQLRRKYEYFNGCDVDLSSVGVGDVAALLLLYLSLLPSPLFPKALSSSLLPSSGLPEDLMKEDKEHRVTRTKELLSSLSSSSSPSCTPFDMEIVRYFLGFLHTLASEGDTASSLSSSPSPSSLSSSLSPSFLSTSSTLSSVFFSRLFLEREERKEFLKGQLLTQGGLSWRDPSWDASNPNHPAADPVAAPRGSASRDSTITGVSRMEMMIGKERERRCFMLLLQYMIQDYPLLFPPPQRPFSFLGNVADASRHRKTRMVNRKESIIGNSDPLTRLSFLWSEEKGKPKMLKTKDVERAFYYIDKEMKDMEISLNECDDQIHERDGKISLMTEELIGKEDQIKENEAKILQLHESLDDAETKISSLLSDKEKSADAVSKMEREIAELCRTLTEKTLQIQKCETRLINTEKETSTQIAELERYFFLLSFFSYLLLFQTVIPSVPYRVTSPMKIS
jgi:hypothetical protein